MFSAAMRRLPKGTCALLDANSTLTMRLAQEAPAGTVIHCDLLTAPIPDWNAHTVIADPPWYPEYIRAFLWCGRALLVPGGRVLLSLPPEGTRPGINDELMDTVAYAAAVGLRLTKVRRRRVRSITPPFERNALRTEGVGAVPEEWRTGDIAEFEWTDADESPRPIAVAYASPWIEREKAGVRVRIRTNTDVRSVEVDPRLVPLVSGDILPTVSRRDRRRAQVRVWTSGNRVFGCVFPAAFRVIATARSQDGDPEEVVGTVLRRRLTTHERPRVRTAAEQLDDLVRTEREEYADAWRA